MIEIELTNSLLRGYGAEHSLLELGIERMNSLLRGYGADYSLLG